MSQNRAEDVFFWEELKQKSSAPASSWAPSTYLTLPRRVKSEPSQTRSNFKVAPKEKLRQSLLAKPQTVKDPAAQALFSFP